jgi:putative oxidoreductase
VSAIKRFFDPGHDGAARDLGLLLLRVGLGFGLVYAHGYGKFMNLIHGNMKFADPLGLGSELSFGLAVFAEFLCAIMVALGVLTRLSTVPLIILFSVAVFLVHGGDEFGVKEKAFLYLAGYLTILFTGPGRLSVDQKLRRR